MACKNCSSLALKRQFPTPAGAARFVRRLRDMVEDGKIVTFRSFTDLGRIEDDCSYPDVIECSFGCPDCGQEFVLKADSHKRAPPQWLTVRRRH
jgi:hypothetical protein